MQKVQPGEDAAVRQASSVTPPRESTLLEDWGWKKLRTVWWRMGRAESGMKKQTGKLG